MALLCRPKEHFSSPWPGGLRVAGGSVLWGKGWEVGLECGCGSLKRLYHHGLCDLSKVNCWKIKKSFLKIALFWWPKEMNSFHQGCIPLIACFKRLPWPPSEPPNIHITAQMVSFFFTYALWKHPEKCFHHLSLGRRNNSEATFEVPLDGKTHFLSL